LRTSERRINIKSDRNKTVLPKTRASFQMSEFFYRLKPLPSCLFSSFFAALFKLLELCSNPCVENLLTKPALNLSV
jgi:hypothetical protein